MSHTHLRVIEARKTQLEHILESVPAVRWETDVQRLCSHIFTCFMLCLEPFRLSYTMRIRFPAGGGCIWCLQNQNVSRIWCFDISHPQSFHSFCWASHSVLFQRYTWPVTKRYRFQRYLQNCKCFEPGQTFMQYHSNYRCVYLCQILESVNKKW